MLHQLLRRIALLRYRRVLSTAMVEPRDEPAASSGASDALRVLLLGSGVASGKGVSTYGLALVGALQRTLQARLGRPVDVELVRQHGAGLARAAELARVRAQGDWDAYVLAFGVSDALRLTPLGEWRRGLGLLLSTIEDAKPWPLPVPIAVAGIPPLQSFSAHRGALMPLLSRHAERLNQATRRLVAAHPAAFFIDLPAVGLGHDRPYGSPDAYDRWAAALGDRLEPVLARSITRVGEGGSAEGLAGALLERRGDGARERLEALARRGRELLDADFAAVRVIDGDQLCLVAGSADLASRSERLDRSVGALALASGAVSVADLATDPRTAGLPMLQGLSSYSGVALHDVDGSVIGTLCVFNGEAGRVERLPELEALGALVEIELGGGIGDPSADEAPESVTGVAAGEDEPLPPWRRVLLRLRIRSRLRTEGIELVEVPRRQEVPRQAVLTIPGPDPIRVLTIGGEYSVGFGVTDRRDALDGAVARLLHRRTGRGVELVNRAGADVGLLRLGASLGPSGAADFDVVLWTPRFIEATRTLLRTRWVLGVGGMVRRVRTTSDAGVVLVGVPALIGRQPMAVLGRARARQINRLLEGVCRRGSRAVYADPAPVVFSQVNAVQGAQVYRDTAVRVFQAVIDALGDAPRRATSASAATGQVPAIA